MTGKCASSFVRSLRWIGPVAMAIVFVFTVWGNMAVQAQASVPSHHRTLEASVVHAGSSTGAEEHCTSGDEDRASSPVPEHGPALHCHAGAVQLGNLTLGATLVVFSQVIDLLRPEALALHGGANIEPPFTPPRSLT